MKRQKKLNISDDERWILHKELKAANKIIAANKLKNEILNSYIYKKPCHHMNGDVN